MRSSVSSASGCTRECTRRAFPGSRPGPATWSLRLPLHVPFLRVAKTSAQFVPLFSLHLSNFTSCCFASCCFVILHTARSEIRQKHQVLKRTIPQLSLTTRKKMRESTLHC